MSRREKGVSILGEMQYRKELKEARLPRVRMVRELSFGDVHRAGLVHGEVIIAMRHVLQLSVVDAGLTFALGTFTFSRDGEKETYHATWEEL